MIEELIKQLPTATPFFVLVAGFFIGLSHAFEPDHVVTVATQNSKLPNISLGIFIENTKINKLTRTSAEVCPAPHNAPRIELLIAPERIC